MNSQWSEEDLRDARIGAILNDLLERRARGERVDTESVLARYPELASELRADLETVRELRPADSIAELVAQGLLSPSADPRYRAELGAYHILGTLGRGGMGIVLKAYEESLNRTVALKILRPELGHDQAVLARFEREARAAAALQHPNIVTIYAVGRERGVHFIAMEYVGGENLGQLVQTFGPLPANLVRRVVRELLAGLSAAHAAGLIHRDIKSTNILLAGVRRPIDSVSTTADRLASLPGPLVRIADFGLARIRKAEAQITLGRPVLGTPDYMSPEQARGANVDARSDLYSTGVVLYELLTGSTPFRADTPTATVHRILHESPRNPRLLNHEADADLCDLAERLMAKSPQDRFASADDTLSALEAGERIRLLERERRWRRRALSIGAAAALVLALGWWIQRIVPATRPDASRELSAVWLDPQDRRTLWGRFGADDSRVLRRFPASCTSLTDALLLRGPQPLVVAGFVDATASECVVAFDAQGRDRWRLDLSSPLAWPDCGPPTRWRCTGLKLGDLDGSPGPELLVSAKDRYEYPARLSIVDPLSGQVRETFWHMGELIPEVIVADYFGPNQPAILVRGLNNKLDGFDTPAPGDPPPATRHDIVAIAAVLDPRTMNGLGPPYTARLPDLPPAYPAAYAFLDAPPLPMGRRDKSPGNHAGGQDLLRIASFGLAATACVTGPELLVRLDCGDEPNARGSLLLNRQLEVRDLIRASAAEKGFDERALRRCWRPLVQDGVVVAGLQVMDSVLDQPRLEAVELDPELPNVLYARFAGSEAPIELHRFGAERIAAATLVDCSGRGHRLAVVGLRRPRGRDTLVAFDALGRERWSIALDSPLSWPDCGRPREWTSAQLQALNVDGHPGEELLVISQDAYEYPTRVDCIDPRTAEIHGTFWHFGNLSILLPLRDFFGATRHAILLSGCNNKLDGFNQPGTGDPEPLTKAEIAQVLMILDPLALHGLGPPAARVPIAPAAIYSYALLDLPGSGEAAKFEDARKPNADSPVHITGAALAHAQPADGTGPWLAISLIRQSDSGSEQSCGLLIVDRHLRLRDASISHDEKIGRDINYWLACWRTVK